jgi:hypothetical protein
MTKDEALKLALEAGMAGFDGVVHAAFQLEAFAALVRADEREACAKVCESYLSESPHSWGGTTMAAAIRARGQA